MYKSTFLIPVFIFQFGAATAQAQPPVATLAPTLKSSVPANGESKGTGVVELEEVVSTFIKLCKYSVEYGKGVSPKTGIKVDPTKLRCDTGLKDIAEANKLTLKQKADGKFILEIK